MQSTIHTKTSGRSSENLKPIAQKPTPKTVFLKWGLPKKADNSFTPSCLYTGTIRPMCHGCDCAATLEPGVILRDTRTD